MEFKIGQVIKLKKPHPCGTNAWKILRVGMDFRLECEGCKRQVMLSRKLVEKNYKGSIEGNQTPAGVWESVINDEKHAFTDEESKQIKD